MFYNISPEMAGISSEMVLSFIKTLDAYNCCTHSFIMARGKKIFAEGYYAPFCKDFKHRMYSVSKSFIGVAVGLVVDDGLLSLEDKFVDFFPEYLNEQTNERLSDMTIQDMLKMETCMGKLNWFFSGTQDRCETYFRTPVERVSGTIFDYDSQGSFMLCALVERLTGKPFLEYMKERFLIKAGFSEDSYCLKCPGGHSWGDSGVMCTARELLIFARFVMDGGKIDGVSYMSEDYLKQATDKQVSNGYGGDISCESYGYGYQIWKAPNDGFAFIGMGDQFAICDREKDFIFIINSDNQGRSPSTTSLLYHELYHTIINNLTEPMAENAEAFKILQDYLKSLKLYNLKGNRNSPFVEEVQGRTYLLDKNSMGIEYVRFDFENDRGLLTYKNEQGVKVLPFGFGHNEFCKFPQEGYSNLVGTVSEKGHMYDCAVSAEWSEEKKLKIYVQIIDKYFGNVCMEFGFKEDKVGIHMVKNAEAFLEEYQGYANGKIYHS